MGAKSKHRRAFLSKHPICCFCAGERLAEEVDHVPSRVLFKSRQWPEGYEFPACTKCNRATRLDEQVIAMLSLIRSNSASPAEDAEIQERIRAVAHNHPDVLEEMKPRVSQLRQASRKYGIQPSKGETFMDLPMLSVRGPLVNGAVDNFSRKLACALFYKHTNAIVPAHASIAVRWYSNLQIDNDEIPRELADVLMEFPRLERARNNLQDQFFYRWGISDTKSMVAFLCFFRQSFAILAFVNCSISFPTAPEEAHILRPYTWA